MKEKLKFWKSQMKKLNTLKIDKEQKSINLKDLAVWKKILIALIMVDIIYIISFIPFMYFELGIFKIKLFLDFLWLLFLGNLFIIWGIICIGILEGDISYIKLKNKFKKDKMINEH